MSGEEKESKLTRENVKGLGLVLISDKGSEQSDTLNLGLWHRHRCRRRQRARQQRIKRIFSIFRKVPRRTTKKVPKKHDAQLHALKAHTPPLLSLTHFYNRRGHGCYAMHSLASAALVNDHDDIRNAFIDAQIHSQIQHFHSTLNGSDSGGGGGADVAVSDAGLYYGTFTDNALSASMYQYTMADFMDIPLPHNPLVDQTSHSDQSVLHHPSDGRRAVASAPRQLDYVVHSSPPHEQRAHDSHVPLESQRKCLFSVPLPSNGHTHTMLPPIVSPSAGGDPSAHFDTDVHSSSPFSLQSPHDSYGFSFSQGSFNQRIARAMDSSTDPCAAAFLQQQLGHEKWSVFSARLFERRLNHGKPKGTDLRAKRLSIDDNITKAGGASTIDFLVKVEVVKEVLRTYVPWVFYRS
jgi:hypothetical protein